MVGANIANIKLGDNQYNVGVEISTPTSQTAKANN
jgi:hypothetical protein